MTETEDPEARRPAGEARAEQGIEVPCTELSQDTLRRLAEEYVTRDGTDYGARERTLEEKVEALLAALRRGDARIFYESVSGTINIVDARALR